MTLSHKDKPTGGAVSQQAREAAKACGPLGPHDGRHYGEKNDKEWWDNYWSGKYDHLRHIQHFARFERELSTNKDETIAKLRKALKPFALIADMSEHLKQGATVGVNINRCRDARAALTSTEKEG